MCVVWWPCKELSAAFWKVSCTLNWILSQKAEKTCFLSFLWQNSPGSFSQTWGSYQHSGLAAVEAVQQRLAADVLVEERHRRAQLGQSQPGKHEGGLVPHEKSHGVPSFVPRQRLQGVGCFVADFVGVGVCVSFIFKNNEGFVRIGSSLLKETIQNEEEWSPPSPRHVRQ